MNTLFESLFVLMGWVSRIVLTIFSTTVVCEALHIKSLSSQLAMIFILAMIYSFAFRFIGLTAKNIYSRTAPAFMNHFWRWLRFLQAIKLPFSNKAVTFATKDETEAEVALIDSHQSGMGKVG